MKGADAYGSKGSVILLPVISILIYLLMIFVEKFPELLNVPGHVTPENIGWIYGNVKSMLVSEKWFLPVSMLYLAGTMIFFLWRAVHFK